VEPDQEEQADTDNQPLVPTGLLNHLKAHMASLSRATVSSLNRKVNMAHQPDLRDITVNNPDKGKDNTVPLPKVRLHHSTVRLLVYLLDLGSLSSHHMANSLVRDNMGSNPVKDSMDSRREDNTGNNREDSTDSNLDRASMVNSLDKVNTVSNPVRVNTANNPNRDSTVNNLDNTVNNLDSTVNSPQLRAEEELMLDTSPPCSSNVSKM
jgi:hypothetical protein